MTRETWSETEERLGRNDITIWKYDHAYVFLFPFTFG